MYDELIKRLRDAAKISEGLAVLLPHSEGNATAKLYNEAADAIEKLLARKETVMGYDARELILFAMACRESDVSERDLKDFARNTEMAFQLVQAEFEKSIQETLSRMIPEPPKEEE